MKAFARLIERLAFTPGRNAKILILRNYLQETPDPDRGWALAALTGALDLRQVSASLLKTLASDRTDPELFALSYHFVGDLAETIALLWPEAERDLPELALRDVIELLQSTPKSALPAVIGAELDRLPASERLAFLKLGTGNLRVGMSLRLAQITLSQMGIRSLEEITEVWNGLSPPYGPLFTWLEGGVAPARALAPFRPVMLSTAVNEPELQALDPRDYFAEWKWDGIRVQASAEGGLRKLYARSGDDISDAFPDIISELGFEGTLDGELLIRRGTEVAPFGDLQKRLGRKTVSRAMRESHPAALRVYDLLLWQGEDLRDLPLEQRRRRLEAINFESARIDISELLPFQTWQDLANLRANPPSTVIEGVMLKRRDSRYLAGRPRGPWFKWKRDPMNIDAVLLYAQSGHGKRSGFYSDFTFGLWHEGALVPVGKAYSGFSDEELQLLDRFVRKNTTQRFGPVRQITPSLVVEVAFEGINRSSRHKSGVALRFPRISRIRWDKPAGEADALATLEALL